MIGVLPKEQQTDVVERRGGEGAENLMAGRKYLPRSIFAIEKSLQGVQINALDLQKRPHGGQPVSRNVQHRIYLAVKSLQPW